jgi:RNA polymerase-associated protein CTR9
MIEQKAAEMLLPMAPAKRSLREMQLAVEQAAHAQKFVDQIQQYTCGC